VYAMYDRVTPDDVRAAARKYFVRSGRTVVTLSHKEGAAAGAPAGAGAAVSAR
jgi:hypothetical protein